MVASISSEEGAVVLHWSEQASVWEPISWSDWKHFRALDNFRPLPIARPGDHYFVVCIIDGRTLYNILPHRYRLDDEGRITGHAFDDLSGEERAFVSSWELSLEEPEGNDQQRFQTLRRRMWRSSLPPKEAAHNLIQNLPGFPATAEDRPVLSFLREFGIIPSSRPSNSLH